MENLLKWRKKIEPKSIYLASYLKMKQFTTYKFKIKSSTRRLPPLASKVNYVWNYCNKTSYKAIKDHRRFLSGFDLGYLTAGASRYLNLNAKTIQSVCEQYAKSRSKDKKAKLKPRYQTGRNRSLNWIPLKVRYFQIKNNIVTFMGQKYRFHKSRDIQGTIKTGAFVQDAVGDWYLTIACEIPRVISNNVKTVGIDLGFKSIAVTSESEDFQNPKLTDKYAEKLATAQKYRHKKAVSRIHRKIARVRADNLHKISRQLVDKYGIIYVGDLKLKASKSSLDSSYRGLITQMTYKASRLGQNVIKVCEKYTTVTCNNCLSRSGPQGQKDLGVREWTCGSCGATHSRDVNAALNILRLGLQLPKTLPLATAMVKEELP